MTIRNSKGENIFLNFREKAPLAATEEMYLDQKGNLIPGKSRSGYLAVAIPGTVLGLEEALLKYGTMNREQVIKPAIDLAENGFILTEADLKIFNQGKSKFQDDNVKAIFLKDGKNPYQVGDILIQKDLAKTLKMIAKQGSKAFYQGEIASKIVQASQENGGILSLEDFKQYQIEDREPLKCNYRNYQVITTPPPGGGITVCQILNILEFYPLTELGFHSTSSIHYLLSAMLYAYVDRNTYLGDPNFNTIPLERLLSKEYATEIKAKIPDHQAIDPVPLYNQILNEGTNTTHYSVIDQYGNAVAVTYTINSYFGAGVIAKDTGFFLNNEMDDFTSKKGEPNQFGLVQGNANLIEPQKRPLSSMSPTIVTKNDQVFLVTGSPGGSTIPTTVVQVITNVIDYNMNIGQAVNAPRFHYQGLPNLVMNQPFGINNQVLQDLFQMGYKLAPLSNWGAAESILVDQNTGIFSGANDSRKPAGKAVAY
jgi:gamma-glutamyltranspeptidase / glutathione hydrolase